MTVPAENAHRSTAMAHRQGYTAGSRTGGAATSTAGGVSLPDLSGGRWAFIVWTQFYGDFPSDGKIRWTRYSRAPDPQIWSSSPPNSNWSSTSRSPRRWRLDVPGASPADRRRGDRIADKLSLSRCPLLAQSGHSSAAGSMSAFGGKADMTIAQRNVCSLTQSDNDRRSQLPHILHATARR